MNCPNRRRKKRPQNGVGTPGCQGTLRLILQVPLDLPVKRMPHGLGALDLWEESVYQKVRDRGIRIAPREVLGGLQTGRWNMVCTSCKWALKTPTKERGC